MQINAQRSRKIALLGVFAAVAIALSILENALLGALDFMLPGVKPGLANIAVVLALYYLGGGAAAVVALAKACASFLATGAVTVLWFSLAGAALSVAGMWLLLRIPAFSLAGVSALGGALANLGQVLVMMMLAQSAAFLYYLPVLVLSGVVFGLLVGVAANLTVRSVPRPMGVARAN